MRRFSSVGRAAACCAVVASCAVGLRSPRLDARPTPPARVTVADEAMGTTFSVVLEGQDADSLTRSGRLALAEAQRLDRLLSNYRQDSEWTQVNRTASSQAVRVSDELFALLSECLAYARETDGAFDITIAPLMRAWGFFRGEGSLPTDEALEQARASVGADKIRLDAARRTVQFQEAGVEIDPGGIGKGYAVDRMAALLRRRHVTAALISAGGSSVYGLGAPSDSPDGWPITIRHPADRQRTAAAVRLRDASLSTSGSYEKFFFAGGERYAHIMDPRTGRPARDTSSVSVVAPRTVDSEVWTKPYFINGREWTARHVLLGWRVFFCDADAQCDWVDP